METGCLLEGEVALTICVDNYSSRIIQAFDYN